MWLQCIGSWYWLTAMLQNTGARQIKTQKSRSWTVGFGETPVQLPTWINTVTVDWDKSMEKQGTTLLGSKLFLNSASHMSVFRVIYVTIFFCDLMFHPFCRLQASYLARGTQKSQQKIWILKTWESLFSCGFDMILAISPNLNKNSNFWDLNGGIPPLKTTATWIKLSFFLLFWLLFEKKWPPWEYHHDSGAFNLHKLTFQLPSEDVSEKCCGPIHSDAIPHRPFGCDSVRIGFGFTGWVGQSTSNLSTADCHCWILESLYN